MSYYYLYLISSKNRFDRPEGGSWFPGKKGDELIDQFRDAKISGLVEHEQRLRNALANKQLALAK